MRAEVRIMANIEEFPAAARKPTEYEALLSAPANVWDAIPGAVYLCDHEGWLVRYNAAAATLWGRAPELSSSAPRFCGSHKLFLPNGEPLAADQCPMAEAVRAGAETRNGEVIVERPDGSRMFALVNIRPLRGCDGSIEGAINCFQDITTQKTSEAELRRKSQELEDFFENSAVGLHIVSSAGIIVRANKAELDLLGYTAEEYIGRHIAEFHADAPVIGEILHRLSGGEKLERYPARLRAKDGSVKRVLITSNSRFDDGQFLNTRCFTTDVTGLHEAEYARRESEARLQATYEAATVGITETDKNGRLLRVNGAICKMLGRSAEELLAMTFLDYTHEDDRDADAAQYQRQVRGEIDGYAIRKRACKSNGTLVYLDVRSSSVRDGDGNFLHGVRVLQDVTEAKLLEDRLRESERQMRDLLEALPAAVYTTDAKGRILFYNKAAVEMAGRVPLVGDEWCVTWRLYNADGTPLAHEQCPMAVALAENRPVRGAEAIAERPDGTRIPFMPFPTPLHDENGSLIGAINMLVDITERKRAEGRQKVLVDELNHRVKNTLATVQSLAGQTARHAASLEDFTARFEARLLALARAHDLLSKRHWEDAPLDLVVRELLAPLADLGPDRLRTEGPSIKLNPRSALSITMALNELVTNATKYGALSGECGALSLLWRVDEEAEARMLTIEWTERGGPPVSPPKRRGFGSRLMERCIEGDLAGALDLEFATSGVQCRISIPLTP
jgi:PAS domain S-box-containing protein